MLSTKDAENLCFLDGFSSQCVCFLHQERQAIDCLCANPNVKKGQLQWNLTQREDEFGNLWGTYCPLIASHHCKERSREV